MKATAHFEWSDGTRLAIPCNWNADGSIAEGSVIAHRIYVSDEFSKAWESDPVRFVVSSDEDPRLARAIEFDHARATIFTAALKLRSRSACRTPSG